MKDQSSGFPYSFRSFWAILLLAVNFFVAYLYFKGIS
ncbi:MAG: photosystem I protein PsaX [Microcoleaceae cyanobacterium]